MLIARPAIMISVPVPGPPAPDDVARQDGDHAVGDDAGQDEPERDAGIGEGGAVHEPDQPRAEDEGRDGGHDRDRDRRPGEDGRDPAGIGLRVDGPAEHHRPEGVGDVPERLGEPARDRVDAGLADAEDGVDEERVRPELEPLGERAGQRPRRRTGAPRPGAASTAGTRGLPSRAATHRISPAVATRATTFRSRARSRLSRAIAAAATTKTSRSPRRATRIRLYETTRLRPSSAYRPIAKNSSPGQRQRGVGELRGGQVRDEDGQRPVRPGDRRQAVQPAGQDDREPADDRGPEDRVGHARDGRSPDRVPATTASAWSIPSPTISAASCE